jgi:hypothetical protein
MKSYAVYHCSIQYILEFISPRIGQLGHEPDLSLLSNAEVLNIGAVSQCQYAPS